MGSPQESQFFPSAELADEDGLIGFGGELSPEWLLDAYSHGIFPWPIFDDTEPVAWWSLDPRAIFELDHFHISRRLQQTLRSNKFRVTCDEAFLQVMQGCATGTGREGGTWITPNMIEAYCKLHSLGHAHSVEVWHGEELAGGVYGVSIGGLFAAESMFHRVRDASKVALANLISHLNTCGFELLDIQQLTSHTESLGAIEISRKEYLRRVEIAVMKKVEFRLDNFARTKLTS